jgi:hypothetical protein
VSEPARLLFREVDGLSVAVGHAAGGEVSENLFAPGSRRQPSLAISLRRQVENGRQPQRVDPDEQRRIEQLHKQLSAAVAHRTTIGIALGILMERHDIDRAAAFSLLHRPPRRTTATCGGAVMRATAVNDVVSDVELNYNDGRQYRFCYR